MVDLADLIPIPLLSRANTSAGSQKPGVLLLLEAVAPCSPLYRPRLLVEIAKQNYANIKIILTLNTATSHLCRLFHHPSGDYNLAVTTYLVARPLLSALCKTEWELVRLEKYLPPLFMIDAPSSSR